MRNQKSLHPWMIQSILKILNEGKQKVSCYSVVSVIVSLSKRGTCDHQILSQIRPWPIFLWFRILLVTWLKANTKQKRHHRSTINRLLWWGLTHWKRKCTPQVSWSFFGAKIMQKMLDTMGSRYRWLSHWAKLSNAYVHMSRTFL